jgi:TolB-like protein
MVTGHFEFDRYRLDVARGTLFRDGIHVPLTPKVAELLVALVRAAGRMVSREELSEHLWPNTVVEEGSLTSHISSLRKALGESPKDQVLIETIPKRGYRFTAPVKQIFPDAPADSRPRHMLVVLPFENLSVGDRYDYFSDGLTEEMITELARLSPDSLGVIARTSAMQFKATAKGIKQIGDELGASHVLEGSVRRVAERMRITVQLIRVTDESHLWAQHYDRGLHDVLEVQAQVARAVAQEIKIKLTPIAECRLHREQARATNPEAYELYLRGRHFWNRRTEADIRKSIECFEQALHVPSQLPMTASQMLTRCLPAAVSLQRTSHFTRPKRRPGTRCCWSRISARLTHLSRMFACTTGIGWVWSRSFSERWT